MQKRGRLERRPKGRKQQPGEARMLELLKAFTVPVVIAGKSIAV